MKILWTPCGVANRSSHSEIFTSPYHHPVFFGSFPPTGTGEGDSIFVFDHQEYPFRAGFLRPIEVATWTFARVPLIRRGSGAPLATPLLVSSLRITYYPAMRNRSSERTGAPPNTFDNAQPRGYNSESHRQPALAPSQVPLPQSPMLTPTTPDHSGDRSHNNESNTIPDGRDVDPDSDLEMFDAASSFGDDHGAGGPPKDDLLLKLPNVFRILDLYQEIGSGGLVEKMIIDQHSLHRLLNTMSPGSYELAWKINFKLLDQLAIKPIGVYGCKPEIIKFLRGVECLNEETEALLAATASSTSGLRSGLYIVLPLNDDSQDGPTRSAYVVYWPEDTTWEDTAISSVRRNRVTFMRYLSKLADQTIALVSAQQAEAIVWQAGARNKDAPTAAAESLDELRMNLFEVAISDESEEDVIATTGFTLKPVSCDIPRINKALCVDLVAGEEKAGLMVALHEPAHYTRESIDTIMNDMRLRSTIGSKSVPFIFGKALPPEQLKILGERGLRTLYPKPFSDYDHRMKDEKQVRDRDYETEIKNIETQTGKDKSRLRKFIDRTIKALYCELYPSIYGEVFQETDPNEDASICEQYSDLKHLSGRIKLEYDLAVVKDSAFQDLKQAWCITRDFVTQKPPPSNTSQENFVRRVLAGLQEGRGGKKGGSKGKPIWQKVLDGVGNLLSRLPKLYGESEEMKDLEFIAALDTLCGYPAVSALTDRISDSLQAYLATLGRAISKDCMARIIKLERERRSNISGQIRDERANSQSRAALLALHEQLRAAMPHSIVRATRIDFIEPTRSTWGNQFHVRGFNIEHREPQIRISIYPLELTEHDIQQCRSNESHIPAPKIGSRQHFEFALPEGHTVEFLRLVRDKCLVIISEPEKYCIYMEDNVRLESVVAGRKFKRQLDHNRVGEKPIFAFDQGTRLLAILHGSEDPKLLTYSFDEQFSTLASRGSAFSLKEWYDAEVHIERMCFVSGSEEVCLIEASGHARILSLVTRHFRPASLTITGRIFDAFSAPDGSCIFVSVATDELQPSRHKLLAFHTASFGSNEAGIGPITLPRSDVRRVVTSFEGRNRVHVLSFSLEEKVMESVALQVKQKVTEFSFQSHKAEASSAVAETINNCLLDCHMEVWTRFPVLPAVLRSTLLPHGRELRRLVFASPNKLDDLDGYFTRMITKFEQTTRKPMDGSLSTISVTASSDSPQDLIRNFACSRFLLGSLIVELLCLIPLHIAITRDNRFIPLKDGVWNPAHERSLLGADVPTVIEKLSLGWYESLFQSYMATKPVRVVSSMGEQSVGKSYCLNHFADTSFAGSAMRTTEGVWLSCTPTEDYLLVSLDFEGVHSIERSAQEDALLVLFNTAISNLVLFRNNFALSRDIAGLFTSFQSSAMVLDPQANPGLFNSTLAIIIKDVTDSDSKDIVKEFSLKFQRIVQKEQQQNFISRLHRGRIQIIPWPVINSPSFYTLFHHLRRYLDKQPVTHHAGGVFLHRLKTLMAKIKASDWGSLDQNLAAHRALQLTERLQVALSRGRAEQGVDSWGPLKNLDTDEELPSTELDALYFVPDVSGNNVLENEPAIEQSLGELVARHSSVIGPRHILGDAKYVDQLQQRLFRDLDQRLEHVRHWIEKNVERFPTSNQDIRNVYSKFENAALVMRTTVRLCLSTCLECHLQCIRPARHSGAHNCTTTHRCKHVCEVTEEHTSPVSCGLL
ncbi:hypothetical protein FS749_015351 [Ceratobasidium sp. UAMH 11750]|nr:hypothetical protein FS749_015351 [Ceratobasidium sp. UAMH 11750]